MLFPLKLPDNYIQAADIQWWPEQVNLDKEDRPENKVYRKTALTNKILKN